MRRTSAVKQRVLPLVMLLVSAWLALVGCSPQRHRGGLTGFKSTELLSGSRLALDRGQYELARAGFQELIDAYPDSPEAPAALFGLGDALLKLYRFTEARLAYDRVASDYPRSVEASQVPLRVGDGYVAQFKFLNADEEGVTAIAVISDDARAALALAVSSYDRFLAASTMMRDAALLKKGDALFLAGDYAGAAAAYAAAGTTEGSAREGLARIKAQDYGGARSVLTPLVGQSVQETPHVAVVPVFGGGIPDKLVLQVKAKLDEKPPDPRGAVYLELGMIDLLADNNPVRAQQTFARALDVQGGQSRDAAY
ncbi:MAG: tetratricopeptide repeat protein, partial [Candidatus Riflebacteria bacterium]|nr:tetratricopeptide repeat protein [Candidatus Riflebacteria bacterium]